MDSTWTMYNKLIKRFPVLLKVILGSSTFPQGPFCEPKKGILLHFGGGTPFKIGGTLPPYPFGGYLPQLGGLPGVLLQTASNETPIWNTPADPADPADPDKAT